MARLLIGTGANPDIRNNYGYTPLEQMRIHNYMPNCKIVALQKVFNRARTGDTPLQIATLMGNAEVVRKFLELGANPNTQNANGVTALHCAALADNAGIARLLINNGADPDIKNNKGFTAYGVAAQYGRAKVIAVLEGPLPSCKGTARKAACSSQAKAKPCTP